MRTTPFQSMRASAAVATAAMCVSLLGVACGRPVLGYYDTNVMRKIEFARPDKSPILMNVAEPVGVDGPRPLVLWIHGGGWAAGSRAGFEEVAEDCASMGYVSATTDYRLTIDGYRFPAQLEDVSAALQYLLDNAEKYQIDRNRVVVGGDSAGGHLALLLGLCRNQKLLGERKAKVEAWHIRGIVNIYGPTDMPALAAIKPANPITRPLLDALMGESPDKAPAKWKNASPVAYVSVEGPPILTVHGALDSIVPFSQAEELDKRCKAVGQSHRLIRVPLANHGWASSPHGPTMMRVLPAIMNFIAVCVAD